MPDASPRAARRFNLGDGLIFVAAAGLAMAMIRDLLAWYDETDNVMPINNIQTWKGFSIVTVTLVSMTFATLAWRLRSPRPRFRHLARQPGLIASGAACLGMFQSITTDLGRFARSWNLPPLHLISVRMMGPVGQSVLLAWLVLWASYRWRPEPGWIDRSGRAVGVTWMALSLSYEAFLMFN